MWSVPDDCRARGGQPVCVYIVLKGITFFPSPRTWRDVNLTRACKVSFLLPVIPCSLCLSLSSLDPTLIVVVPECYDKVSRSPKKDVGDHLDLVLDFGVYFVLATCFYFCVL